MNVTDMGWVFAERIPPQWLIGSGLVLLVIVSMMFAAFEAGLFPASAYEVVLGALLSFWVGLTVFILEIRCPKAVRATACGVEVMTRIGRVTQVPRADVELATSWPEGWGSLKRMGRPPAMFLTPRQYEALFKLLVEPYSEIHLR